MVRAFPFGMKLAGFLVLVAACGVVVPYVISRSVPEDRIEGNPLSPLIPGGQAIPIPLEIDLEAEAAARDAGPVNEVTLQSVRLNVTTTEEPAGDTDDWGFVDSIVVDVESTAEGSALPRREVARLDPTPDGARQLDLETDTSANLRPYVEEGARLVATVRGRAPTDAVSYDGVVEFGLSFL